MAGRMSMADFKALKHCRGLLEEARSVQRTGDAAAALPILEQAVASTSLAAEARVALAQAVWDSAANESDLQRAETLLVEAISVARAAQSAPEVATLEKALSKLALLLCQNGRDAEAEALLQEGGFSFRLSAQVLRGVGSPDAGDDAEERDRIVAIFDQAFPQDMLAMLQEVFKPRGLYWTEHDYYAPERGYFSYMHTLDGTPPRNGMEQVIRHLQRLAEVRFPAVKDATRAEWWAHCRPHPSGHQLHFDSDDEGLGGVRNPIATSVMYLSEGTGGPTLITNQRVEDAKLAGQGWLVFPTTNRFVAFDGKVLHGVIPGASFSEHPERRRITLMVAFWKECEIRGSAEDGPGASRTFPVQGATRYSWQAPMEPLVPQWDAIPPRASASAPLCLPVSCIWDAVAPAGEGGAAGGQSALAAAARGGARLPGYEDCFQGF